MPGGPFSEINEYPSVPNSTAESTTPAIFNLSLLRHLGLTFKFYKIQDTICENYVEGFP